jgi:hypothetical protein
MTVTVRLACENHQPFSALWRFEQGQSRKRREMIPAGKVERGERKQTASEASKAD